MRLVSTDRQALKDKGGAIDMFVRSHCHSFDDGSQEHRLEYTTLHKEFSELMETQLEAFCEEEGFRCGFGPLVLRVSAQLPPCAANAPTGPSADPARRSPLTARSSLLWLCPVVPRSLGRNPAELYEQVKNINDAEDTKA